MGRIDVTGIRTYSYHGCIPEEAKVGGWFVTDLALWTDLTKAATSDDLLDTIDYGTAAAIVQKEMTKRSDLLEHVAGRIMQSLKEAFPTLDRASVSITKLSAPIPGQVKSVGVTLEG